eukprot:jgi/Galph1/2763/GphlegSOOS_G1378.1
MLLFVKVSAYSSFTHPFRKIVETNKFHSFFLRRKPFLVSIRSYQTATHTSRSEFTVRCLLLERTSSLIGYLVVGFSAVYKMPQIWRLMRKRSGQGVSLAAYLLETVGILLSLLYCVKSGFPWETFAENGLVAIQNIIISGMLIHYHAFDSSLIALIIVYLLCSFLYLWQLPMGWKYLQIASVPLIYVSKIPQLLMNHRKQSTGELSPITLGLQVLGNIARIFTTVVQLQDRCYLFSILPGLLLNLILLFQYLKYHKGSLSSGKNYL